MTRLSREQIDAIPAMYEGGMSLREIARECNVLHDAIAYHLRKAGVKIRPPHIGGDRSGPRRHPGTAQKVREIVRMRKDRHTFSEIARELGCSYSNVYDLARRHAPHVLQLG